MTVEARSSGRILMVRPAAFGFHAEAAQSNAFANDAAGDEVTEAALREFEGLANALQAAGVEVLILDDTPNPPKPDAVFPNNWVSFHGDGTIILYPMATAARRHERKTEALKRLLADRGFTVRKTIDLSPSEQDGQFHEGTGSLILDRPGHRAFAALGPRTMQSSLHAFATATGFEVVAFSCADRQGRPIYHTNVLLSLGDDFALVCADAIAADDRDRVLSELGADGRDLITLGFGDQACLKMCRDRIIPAQRAIDIEKTESKNQTINITVEAMSDVPMLVMNTIEGESKEIKNDGS